MTTLQFADTHNLVAFLAKPAKSEGFEQIVDFLNAHYQAKTINRELQLEALVDGKKIIIPKASVRRDLQLNDKEGTNCLTNATIFEEVTRMSAKTTAWNEFSSTMASAIICLATNQKFNFSKYIFESMVKNLENMSGKFLMYLRKQRPRKPKRKDTKIPQPTYTIVDEAVYKERDDSLVRAATTASSLKAEQDSGDIDKTRSRKTLNESSFLGTSFRVWPEALQDTIRGTQLLEIGLSKFSFSVSKTSNDSLLVGVSTPRRGCIQTGEKIDELYKRWQRFTKKLVHETHGRYGDEEMFDTCILDGDEVLAEPEVTVKDVNLSVDEVTLAQALAALKSAKVQEKVNVVEEPSESITITPTLTTTTAATTIIAVSTRPKAKGLVIHEEEQATTPTVSSQQPLQVKSQDKGKGIMVEEPMKMKKKYQIILMKNLLSSYKLKKKKKKKKGLPEKKLKEKKKPTLLHGIMCKQ
ncbi:hypothetical protein Tco_0115707 [Tanacetum coccineum]